MSSGSKTWAVRPWWCCTRYRNSSEDQSTRTALGDGDSSNSGSSLIEREWAIFVATRITAYDEWDDQRADVTAESPLDLDQNLYVDGLRDRADPLHI